MAFIPGYLHDVFISYACADDALADGLIGNFWTLLTKALCAEGLRLKEDQADGVDVFLDRRRLHAGNDLTEQVLTAARCSAVFIAFHSLAYVGSSWCQREAAEFSGMYDPRWPRLDGRLFVVALGRGGSPAQSPVQALRSRRFRRFFYVNADGYDFPFEPDLPGKTVQKNEDGYHLKEEVIMMAREIAKTLKKMREESPAPRVFLADTSEAGRAQAEDIKNRLIQEQALVFRASSWSGDWAAESRDLIAQADLFIDIHEKVPQDVSMAQVCLAKDLQKPRITWLPRGQLNSDDAQKLMAQTTVIEGKLEEFKEALPSLLAQPSARHKPAPVPGPGTGNVNTAALNALILVVGANKDESLVTLIEEKLDRLGCGRDAFLSEDVLENPDTGTWQRGLQKILNLYDNPRAGVLAGVVFVDGDCNGPWADQRLRDLVVLLSDAAPRTKQALCTFPPPVKPRRYRPPKGLVKRIDGGQLDELKELL